MRQHVGHGHRTQKKCHCYRKPINGFSRHTDSKRQNHEWIAYWYVMSCCAINVAIVDIFGVDAQTRNKKYKRNCMRRTTAVNSILECVFDSIDYVCAVVWLALGENPCNFFFFFFFLKWILSRLNETGLAVVSIYPQMDSHEFRNWTHLHPFFFTSNCLYLTLTRCEKINDIRNERRKKNPIDSSSDERWECIVSSQKFQICALCASHLERKMCEMLVWIFSTHQCQITNKIVWIASRVIQIKNVHRNLSQKSMLLLSVREQTKFGFKCPTGRDNRMHSPSFCYSKWYFVSREI